MAEELVITTNHVPRFVLDPGDLSLKEREEFTYLDWDAMERGDDYRSFIRYRGWVYDLSDCEGIFPLDKRWFYVSDTFFSGVLFRYAPDECNPDKLDPERVICANYYIKG